MQIHEQIEKRNVLIGVDIQNDFIDGTLAVPGGIEVVSPINELARRVRATHMGRVAYTRDWHPMRTPHFNQWPVHCVRNTRGAEFHPKLDIQQSDIIVSKGMGQTDGYSGAEGKSPKSETLESMIQPDGWEDVRVFIGGLATDYCVKATAIDLATIFSSRQNVEVYAMQDAMRAVNMQPEDEIEAIKAMAEAGVHIIDLEQAFRLIDQKRIER